MPGQASVEPADQGVAALAEHLPGPGQVRGQEPGR